MTNQDMQEFYSSPKIFFIFEKMEECANSFSALAHSMEHAKELLPDIKFELKGNVSHSTPGDVIFVIEKKFSCFWHVIIGDKIGWIFVREQDELMDERKYIFPLTRGSNE
jgi:hypothetical protein